MLRPQSVHTIGTVDHTTFEGAFVAVIAWLCNLVACRVKENPGGLQYGMKEGL